MPSFFQKTLSYSLVLFVGLFGIFLSRSTEPGVLYYFGFTLVFCSVFALFRLIALHTASNQEAHHKFFDLPIPEKGWKSWLTYGVMFISAFIALLISSNSDINEPGFFFGLLTAIVITLYAFFIIHEKV